MSRRLAFTLILLSFAAAAAVAQPAPVNLTDQLFGARWHSDEFDFRFSPDGTFVAYQTQGSMLGTVRGTWTAQAGSRELGAVTELVLTRAKTEGSFFDFVFEGGTIRLTPRHSRQDPKTVYSLVGLGGNFILWHEKSFLPADATVRLPGGLDVVTTGYRLTATTQNLRLRDGPSTDYEYRIWSYPDAASGTIKTWTSVYAGTNLRILARTQEKAQVGSWYNYWYYVEYKEPTASGLLVYRNAWMFGEFLNVEENRERAITIDSPENEQDYYSDYSIWVEGSVTGAPVSVTVQVKNAYGIVLAKLPATEYDQRLGVFRHKLSKENQTLFIGSNTVNIIATYSDGKTSQKQITFYVHEYMGEAAKPVIYLYPTRETEVTVRVSPPGGVTVSEPAYGAGWTVLAKPDGTLVNRGDGSVWPYLFWESDEAVPPMPESGFVLERSALPGFFRDKLAFLGLSPAEIDDFLEYWIPVLVEGPWYLVSFTDQAAWDARVPLEVSPRPDTVIRVFFDARPLAAPVTVKPQALVPRARKGFTVVEWGGMRYPH